MPRPAPLSPSRQHPLMLVWQPCHPCSGRPLRFAVFRNAFRERLRAAAASHRMGLLDWLALPDGFVLLCAPVSLAQFAAFVATLKSTAAADARRRHPGRQLWRGRYALALVQPAALTQCLLTIDPAAIAGGLVPHPAAWTHSGWHELAGLHRRYRLLLPTAAGAALASAAPAPQRATHPTPAGTPTWPSPNSACANAAMGRYSPGPPPSPSASLTGWTASSLRSPKAPGTSPQSPLPTCPSTRPHPSSPSPPDGAGHATWSTPSSAPPRVELNAFTEDNWQDAIPAQIHDVIDWHYVCIVGTAPDQWIPAA